MNITAILQYLLHMGADLLDSFLISHKLSLLCAGSLPLCGYAGTFFDVCYVKDIDRQGQGLVDFLHGSRQNEGRGDRNPPTGQHHFLRFAFPLHTNQTGWRDGLDSVKKQAREAYGLIPRTQDPLLVQVYIYSILHF